MLSNEEKKEMLEDAKNKRRMEHFRSGKEKNFVTASLDIYVSFLDSIQRIFSPFKIPRHPTITKFNKL